MWLSKPVTRKPLSVTRSIFILLVTGYCFLVTGCGFTPLYAPHAQSLDSTFADIEISSIANRNGQTLRNLLIDQLYTQGRPAAARYELKISNPKESIARLGIRKDASATRAQLRLSVTASLIDRFDGATVLSRNLRSINSYNVLDSQFTTMITEEDARQRGLKDISEQIVTQLALYFQRPKPSLVSSPATPIPETSRILPHLTAEEETW